MSKRSSGWERGERPQGKRERGEGKRERQGCSNRLGTTRKRQRPDGKHPVCFTRVSPVRMRGQWGTTLLRLTVAKDASGRLFYESSQH